MKTLIINIDDLGLHPSINQAVCELATKKRIQSASFMSLGNVNADEWQVLKSHNIEIGLHLDLTGLGNQGNLKSVLIKSWLRAWDNKALQDMISRQLDNFENQAGVAPVFVDGHQHIHQFPQIRTLLLNELQRRYHNHLPKLRNTHPFGGDLKSLIIHQLGGEAFVRLAKARGFVMNDSFGGVYDFKDNMPQLQQRWDNWLMLAPHGALIMCHPARPADWVDEIKAARELEYDWLISDAFGELLERHGIRFQSWQDFL